MAEVLKYDFERTVWPLVGGGGGGISAGGATYAVTENPIYSLIAGGAGAVAGYLGGKTYEDDKVFDKSEYGNTGMMKNGAYIRNGVLFLDGVDDVVEAPSTVSLKISGPMSIEFECLVEDVENQQTIVSKHWKFDYDLVFDTRGGRKRLIWRHGNGEREVSAIFEGYVDFDRFVRGRVVRKADGTIIAYKDGEEFGREEIDPTVATGDYPVRIGLRPNDTGPFSGRMRHVAIRDLG